MSRFMLSAIILVKNVNVKANVNVQLFIMWTNFKSPPTLSLIQDPNLSCQTIAFCSVAVVYQFLEQTAFVAITDFFYHTNSDQKSVGDRQQVFFTDFPERYTKLCSVPYSHFVNW